ncbi:hypothetical protein C2E23DRAFT_42476 [Lenzites betulinus]|nr:hypothetical protein C2E23DRAFT_42476 [Lenzites betulinus]
MASPVKKSDQTTASSSRPSSPSPARSMRTRMTSVMRRASTGLAFGSKLPTLSRSSSKNSLRVDPAQAPTTSETHVAPSPVAEMGEESPSIPAALGPSPLHNSSAAPPSPLQDSSATPEQTASEPVTQPEPAAEPAPATAEVVVSAPAEEVQEEQLTRSPEHFASELPHAAPAPAPEPQPFGFSDPILPTTEAPAVVESPVLAPSDAPAPSETAVAAIPEPTPSAPLPPPAEPVARPVLEDQRADYFSFGDPVVPAMAQAEQAPPQVQPEAPAAPAPPHFPVAEPAMYQDVSHMQISTDDSTFAWSDEPALGHKRSRSSLSGAPAHVVESSQQSDLQSGKVSTRGSKSSLASSYGNIIPNASNAEQRRGRSSSVR